MIEYNFDVPFISSLALREKQIQQNYRPLIAVHKWFARRPGTLFRGLLISEFASGPISEEFYRAQDFGGKRIADPFMGGGTPLVEANRTGCATIGFDINPMAWWIVREQIEHLNVASYRRAAADLRASLEQEIGYLYRTRCVVDGRPDAPVKYFLWVKVLRCDGCGNNFDLFPGYLVDAGIYFSKTHNLIALLTLALAVEPSWSVLQQQLRALNVYAIDYRYPGNTATKTDAKDAMKDCREVRRVIRQAFGLKP